jgi:hypothetical protein
MRMQPTLLALGFAVAAVAPISAGIYLGSSNTLHLGYDEPAGKTATKHAELMAIYETNHVNMLQEVMKTDAATINAVKPGGYVYQVTALQGPSTYKEAYAWVYSASTTGSVVKYPSGTWDRAPHGFRVWTGSNYVWTVNYHAPFDSTKMNTEIPAMAAVYTYFRDYTTSTNDVVIGGDWNRSATHANFTNLKDAGCTKIEPNVATSINTSGAWASAYDHFVWNPTNTSVTGAAREAVDPAYWRANVSDHAPIYCWINY